LFGDAVIWGFVVPELDIQIAAKKIRMPGAGTTNPQIHN
jgi:hypothetical protein